MALTPAFSVSQSYATPNLLHIVDNSTGSDGTITIRRVYLTKSDGTYLVPTGTNTSYVEWLYSASTIDINVLDKDYPLNVTVVWLAGSTPVYNLSQLEVFTAYSETFLRNLTAQQASNPNLINNKNFFYNKMRLRTLTDDAVEGADLLNDISISQYALNQAKALTDNPKLFY